MRKVLLYRGAILLVLLGMIFLSGGCRKGSGSIQGYIEGEFVYVASQVGGVLKSVDVDRGDKVKPGDLLFKIDPEPESFVLSDAQSQLRQTEARLQDLRKGQRPEEIAAIEAQLEQAKAALELAGSKLRRMERLAAAKVSSPEELDQAQSTFDQAKKRVDELSSQLDVARLGARSDQVAAAEADVGRARAAVERAQWALDQKMPRATVEAPVFDTLYRAGEVITAGQAVVVLLPPENVKVRAFIPETMLGSVHAGDPVEFAVDGNPERLHGKVSFISQKAEYTPPVIYSLENRSKLVFLVEIAPDAQTAPRLHPGQPADIWFRKP